MSVELFTRDDRKLLLWLLEIPTAGPLEATTTDPAPRLWQAQRAYAEAAQVLGFQPIHHDRPASDVTARTDVPVAVQRAAGDPDFLAQQPSLVLRLGPALPRAATVMFNVHLDTVGHIEPVALCDGRFTGRGAIDAKGPAVALLAGIRDAIRARPAVGRHVSVLIQAVSGEEGGAMGTYGTRPLIESGYLGRLNIFCEPTNLRYLPRCTASMTARLRVDGHGAIDDHPDVGHNATVLLGFLAQHLARELDPWNRQGRLCVAGAHTGELHNRIYGRGELLLNLSYASATEGAEAARKLERSVNDGIRLFREIFAGTREFNRTAADAASITTVEWLKRDLPALDNTDPWAEGLLTSAGATRWPDSDPAFTCDAIWMDGVSDAYTAVLGPGDLKRNNAHAEGEFADVSQLQRFAAIVSALLIGFADHTVSSE